MQALIDDYFEKYPLGRLPEALREVREYVFVKSNKTQTAGMSLLWDDPNRFPEQADVPLDEVPLEFPT